MDIVVNEELKAYIDPMTSEEYEALERSIDVAIARLRKLLEDDPKQPRMLQTVWGVGYVYVPPEQGA